MIRMHDVTTLYGEKQRRYFRDASGMIAEDNLRTLTGAATSTVGILTFFLLLAPCIIEGWQPSVYHLSFWPTSFLFCVFSWLVRRRKFGYWVTALFCVLFEGMVFTFVILIDAVASWNSPASFVPVMSIALPAIFTLPIWISYGLPLVAVAAFIGTALQFKDPVIGQYDIFNSLVGLLCSVVMNHLIFSLRLRDYETRMRYKQQSTYDSLTGLYNKQSSTEAIRQYFNIHNPETVCAVLALDLDNFKHVNDTHGHYVGDQVLHCMGETLLNSFRSTDIVSRFGGDEFFVLLKGTASQALVERKCQQVQDVFQDLTRAAAGIPVGCSIGAILVRHCEVEFESLFRQADMALYRAKTAGKGQYLCLQYPVSEEEEA